VAAVERAISAAGHVIVDKAVFPAADQAASRCVLSGCRGFAARRFHAAEAANDITLSYRWVSSRRERHPRNEGSRGRFGTHNRSRRPAPGA
jgi:hypothetical protein